MQKRKGIILAIVGASLWGGSGAGAQAVFQTASLSPIWLTAFRLLVSGLVLTIYCFARRPDEFKTVVHNRHNMKILLLFAIVGMLNSQLTYFMAIKYSNAPTATVLQYLQPVLIILWLSISQKQWPRRLDVISICFALVGTFYLVTGGHLHSLTLTPRALAWGLACGLAAALYVLIPRSLLQKYDSLIVCAIGMLISGIALSPVLLMMPWPKLSVTNWLIVAYIVIGGTMLAYPFFLQSTRYISPAVTSILGSFEPLIATVLAVTLLGTRLTVATVIGSLLILFTTFLQSIPLNRINFLIHRKGRG